MRLPSHWSEVHTQVRRLRLVSVTVLPVCAILEVLVPAPAGLLVRPFASCATRIAKMVLLETASRSSFLSPSVRFAVESLELGPEDAHLAICDAAQQFVAACSRFGTRPLSCGDMLIGRSCSRLEYP
jgi:hypothetical protein